MKLYQIGAGCQLETDVVCDTSPLAEVWSDNQRVLVSREGAGLNLLGY